MSSLPTSGPSSRLGIVFRIVTAILGGWAFSWGLVACGTACLVGLGADFHDAEMVLQVLGLLIFLGVFLWSFAEQSLLRIFSILVGGAVLLNTSALLIQHAILN